MAKESKGKKASAYRSVGTTSDGVRVIAPKLKPTSFTSAQIRTTIRQVLRDHRAGNSDGENPENGSTAFKAG